MGILDFFSKQAPETKDSQAAPTLVMTPGQPVWSPRDYAAFAKEAYQMNAVAYACINRIADAVSSVGWEAWRGKTQIVDSPILDLIANPNPQQSGKMLMQEKVSYYLIAGNGYDERVMVGGEPRELYALRPDRMTVIPDASGMVSAYQYKIGGKPTTWEVDEAGASDINHLKAFNPINDWYGQSPIDAGAYAVDQHNSAMSWMQALLQNSAIPSGALTKNEGELSEEQFQRLKAQIEEQYAGARNAGRPMLLEGGLDWRGMGMSPDDMNAIETKNSAARDIALAFGVPPMLLGIPGDNTYANYAEARLSFWEDTVIPLLNVIAEDWSNWLGSFYNVTLKPDLDQVPAIVDKRKTLWEMAEKSQVLTVNEKRELMGFDPVPEGNTILVPSNLLPIDIDASTAIKLAGYNGETK